MKTLIYIIFICMLAPVVEAQTLTANRAHSHNDYKQAKPFVTAYSAGAGSIEADVFLLDGKLYVAHERTEIDKRRTLTKLYLKPLAKLFRKNGGKPYADSAFKLQLVIDIKENYAGVIPELIKELKPFKDVFADKANKNTVKIVLSGDMPPPGHFSNYPDFIWFDGRPTTVYNDEELKRVAMISVDVHRYNKWSAQVPLTTAETTQLQELVRAAHDKGKPFRFWATPDTPEAWALLEKIGVNWINTDHPQGLQTYFTSRR